MGKTTKTKTTGAIATDTVPRRISKTANDLAAELANEFPITIADAIELALVEVAPIWRKRGTITITRTAA